MEKNSQSKPIFIIAFVWSLLIGMFLISAFSPDIFFFKHTEKNAMDDVEELEVSPFYDYCMSQAAKKGDDLWNNAMKNQGFTQRSDGTFRDAQGKLPSIEIENEVEMTMTDFFIDCIVENSK